MKQLRNFYFILGLFAIAFAVLTKFVPGVSVTDFVNGFCWGLGITMLIAGIVTSAIPYLYRKEKKKKSDGGFQTDPSASTEGNESRNS